MQLHCCVFTFVTVVGVLAIAIGNVLHALCLGLRRSVWVLKSLFRCPTRSLLKTRITPSVYANSVLRQYKMWFVLVQRASAIETRLSAKLNVHGHILIKVHIFPSNWQLPSACHSPLSSLSLQSAPVYFHPLLYEHFDQDCHCTYSTLQLFIPTAYSSSYIACRIALAQPMFLTWLILYRMNCVSVKLLPPLARSNLRMPRKVSSTGHILKSQMDNAENRT